MVTGFRSIERAKEEPAQIHAEVVQLEARVDALHRSLSKAIAELFGTDRKAFPASQEAALAARIVEAVLSRHPVNPHASIPRKQYVREREAAEYMGVRVSTLRSKHGLRSPASAAW
jgi:hypothetical protein